MDNRRFNNNRNESDYRQFQPSRNRDQNQPMGQGYGYQSSDYDPNYYEGMQSRPSWQPMGERDMQASSTRNWQSNNRDQNQYNRNFEQGRSDFDRSRSSFGSFDQNRSQDFTTWSDRKNQFQDQHSSGRGESMIEKAQEAVKNFFGKGPKGYQRSDERIREDVCEALYRHPRIDASEIEVSVKAGTVTLTGTVDDRSTKRLVEDVVEDCSGVSNVSNQILVGQGLSSQSQMSSTTTQQGSMQGSRSKSIQ